jgi:hypothetical protein
MVGVGVMVGVSDGGGVFVIVDVFVRVGTGVRVATALEVGVSAAVGSGVRVAGGEIVSPGAGEVAAGVMTGGDALQADARRSDKPSSAVNGFRNRIERIGCTMAQAICSYSSPTFIPYRFLYHTA